MPAPLRVAYLNPVSELGGAEFSLLDLMAAVGEAGPQVERHLIVGAEGPLVERARKLRVNVHVLPMPRGVAELGDSGVRGVGSLPLFGLRLAAAAGPAYTYIRRLRRLLAELAPDIIHSNAIKMHLFSAMAKPRGLPVIWHVRDFLSSRAMMSKVLARAAGGASCAIAISEAIRKDLQELVPTLPVKVVYDAIDTDLFCPAPADEPQPRDMVRVGLVSTYARWKGQMLFLEAAEELMARNPDLPVRYFIIGGPIYRTPGSQFSVEELQHAIEAKGLEERVELIPFQAEPVAIYRMLDIVVHASTRPEPFGRTIAEAMACGRPVIVSMEGGAAELFRDGQDAMGFCPRDGKHLASVIEKLVTDRTLAFKLGRAARQAAVERFAKPRLAEEVFALYEEQGSELRRPTQGAGECGFE